MTQDIHILYFAMVIAMGLASLAPMSFLPGAARTVWNLGMVALASMAVATRDVSLGADTRTYLEMFEDPGRFEDFVETAYILALRGLGAISSDGTFFLFASSLATNLVVYLGFARVNARLAGLAFAFFVATPVFWLANVLILRNGLAAALIASATMILVTSGRTKSFFATALAGALFHYSLVGHALMLATADLRNLRRIAISLVVLAIVGAMLFALSSSFAALAAPWIIRYEDYQYYASTGRGSFGASRIEPQHAFPVLVAIGAFLARSRLRPEESLLLRYYFVMVLVAAAFWSNVLFRDRLYLPAQMLEPLFFVLLFRRLLDDRAFLLVSLFSLTTLASVTILVWGPRNVLQYYY